MSLASEDYILIASIVSAHGIKGEVNIKLFGNPENLNIYDHFFIDGLKCNISFRSKNFSLSKSQTSLSFLSDAKGSFFAFSKALEKDAKGSFLPASLCSSANAKGFIIGKLERINDRNEAEKLRGKSIFVHKSQMPKLELLEEFYPSDLIGIKLLDDQKREVGEIIDVANYGASDIVTIRKANASEKDYPFISEIFQEIDLANKTANFIEPEEI